MKRKFKMIFSQVNTMVKPLEIKTQWIKSNMDLVNLSFKMEGNIQELGRMANAVDKDD